MESGLSWTLTNANHHSITVLFCTDSKSLCEALISIITSSNVLHPQFHQFHFIFNIYPVDPIIIATDTTLPISLSSSIQIINETIRDAPPIHERVAAVYKHRRVSRDVKQITNRKDDVLIARLRFGHHPSLKQYLHRLDPSQDPTCPNCRQEEQDLVHWLRDCPALLSVWQRVFRCHQGSLEWLASRPGMKWRTQGRPWSTLTPNPITTNG